MTRAALRFAWGAASRALALPLRLLVWLYQRLLSPVLPPACRYYPSCSRYAAEALALRGPAVGTFLAIRRLLRCHPWSQGGFDFVPPRANTLRTEGAPRSQVPHPRHG